MAKGKKKKPTVAARVAKGNALAAQLLALNQVRRDHALVAGAVLAHVVISLDDATQLHPVVLGTAMADIARAGLVYAEQNPETFKVMQRKLAKVLED